MNPRTTMLHLSALAALASAVSLPATVGFS
jgi:hypothetical protein